MLFLKAMPQKILSIVMLISIINISSKNVCASTTYTHRQLSYNPILENSLNFNNLKECDDWCSIFTFKPIYMQSVGNKFQRYFNINHKPYLNVQENGTGDIDSLWFKVISSNDTFYSSKLCFRPVRQEYGTMFFTQFKLPCDFSVSINTAFVGTRYRMRPNEFDIQNQGTVNGYRTILESLDNNDRVFGKVGCQSITKSGVDDIQIKIIKSIRNDECMSLDFYGLIGVPTGKRSKAIFMFEPMIGSKHAQLGLGSYLFKKVHETDCGDLNLLAEVKYRYAFSATERRIFDLQLNRQWSRYMLLVDEADKYIPFLASNHLAICTKVKPKNNLDVFVAINKSHNCWQFEIGYDFFYRDRESVEYINCDQDFPRNYGIADLRGIAEGKPQSANSANISQSVLPGKNQMISNSKFIKLTKNMVNLDSGAAPKTISNSICGSVAYKVKCCDKDFNIGIGSSYEIGSNINSPNFIYSWAYLNWNY